jgi:asparagine synthase (glutamine-hydrolysing)
MQVKLAKRGPDGEGLWWSEDRRVGLAHRRLAIIDLADRALQPMAAADGNVLVYNGEIYNYRELRQELEASGQWRFQTQSDTEVLLALWQVHGPRMVSKLRGMFAFALWDAQGERLFLARDPHGVKPLYFAIVDGSFYFASQVKALLSTGKISDEADPAGLVGFEIWGSVPEPFTLYRAIQPLPAGSTLMVDPAGPSEPHCYAHVASLLAGTPRDDARPVSELVREAALDTVRAHLVADVEVGLFLSSGIDCGQARVRAVTLGFEELAGSPSDEVPLARRVATLYGAEHHVQPVTKGDFERSAEQLLADMDQPTIDGVNAWFVSKAAADLGLKVVLSGLGGDELLAGYSTFSSVPKLHRFRERAARLPLAAAFANFVLRRLGPRLVRRQPKLAGIFDHPQDWGASYLLRRAVLLPFEVERVLDPAAVREGLERLQVLDRVRTAISPDPGHDLARVAALEASLYMRNQLLRDADWASMAHSLELRVPFVDWPTLQRIAPIMHRLGGGSGKRALACSPSIPLPDEVRNRARSGFSVPMNRWLHEAAAGSSGLASRHWGRRVAAAFSPSMSAPANDGQPLAAAG